eukprot:scpid88181/ scgid23917/ 
MKSTLTSDCIFLIVHCLRLVLYTTGLMSCLVLSYTTVPATTVPADYTCHHRYFSPGNSCHLSHQHCHFRCHGRMLRRGYTAAEVAVTAASVIAVAVDSTTNAAVATSVTVTAVAAAIVAVSAAV